MLKKHRLEWVNTDKDKCYHEVMKKTTNEISATDLMIELKKIKANVGHFNIIKSFQFDHF